jgi:hypothetical protein
MRPDRNRQAITWFTSLAGVGLLVVTGIQAVTADEGQGLVGIAIVGALLLVSPLVVDRLESLEVGSGGVELKLSKAISDLGAPRAASQLETSGLTGFVESYEFIRRELQDDRYHDARLRLQDALVERAASLARTEKFDAAEVRRIFAEGSPLLRVLTLGLMEGDPSLSDGPSILSAIAGSRTANEQYHGLKLADMTWLRLTPGERASIVAAADADPRIARDSDRRTLADSLRTRLADETDTGDGSPGDIGTAAS